MNAAPGPGRWNVIVTAREGTTSELKRALAPLARFERAPFRNLLVGSVPDPEAFLEALAKLRDAQPFLDNWLGKVLPTETTFPLDLDRFQAQLEAAVVPFLPRIAGRRFHVRVERRGHKGAIDSQRTERALGDFIYDRLAAEGRPPTVDFRDPEVVLAVEIVGNTVGIALVTRELRRRFPFVKID